MCVCCSNCSLELKKEQQIRGNTFDLAVKHAGSSGEYLRCQSYVSVVLWLHVYRDCVSCEACSDNIVFFCSPNVRRMPISEESCSILLISVSTSTCASVCCKSLLLFFLIIVFSLYRVHMGQWFSSSLFYHECCWGHWYYHTSSKGTYVGTHSRVAQLIEQSLALLSVLQTLESHFTGWFWKHTLWWIYFCLLFTMLILNLFSFCTPSCLTESALTVWRIRNISWRPWSHTMGNTILLSATTHTKNSGCILTMQNSERYNSN